MQCAQINASKANLDSFESFLPPSFLRKVVSCFKLFYFQVCTVKYNGLMVISWSTK